MHVMAENWEAHGYRTARCPGTDTPLLRPWLQAGCKEGWPRTAGVPWRVCYEATRFGYLIARSRGDKAYEKYACYRYYRGVISGTENAGVSKPTCRELSTHVPSDPRARRFQR